MELEGQVPQGAISVGTVQGVLVDAEVNELAGSVADEVAQHLSGLSVNDADLQVVFEHFQFAGERGSAKIRLGGTVNGLEAEAQYEWQGLPPSRTNVGGNLIASVVSNSMHGGADGIRQATIENVLSASVAAFCAQIDDTLGVETSMVRAGMKAAWRWGMWAFAAGLMFALFGVYRMVGDDGDLLRTIPGAAIGGTLFAMLPAVAASSLRMMFIPSKEIENSPYGVNLMNAVGIKSGFGVQCVFAGFLLGSIALATLLVVKFVGEL